MGRGCEGAEQRYAFIHSFIHSFHEIVTQVIWYKQGGGMVIYMEQDGGHTRARARGLYKDRGGEGGGRGWPTLGDIHGRIQPSDNASIAVQQQVLDVVESRVDEHGLGVVPTTTLETHLVR